MNPIEAVQSALRQYTGFSGRARRSEFWWFFLFVIVLSFASGIVDGAIGINYGDSGYGPVGVVVLLALALPSLALNARRLHDTGRSGWWQLLGLVPCLGFIILIVWWCQPSEDDNQYGPHPATPNTWDLPR